MNVWGHKEKGERLEESYRENCILVSSENSQSLKSRSTLLDSLSSKAFMVLRSVVHTRTDFD